VEPLEGLLVDDHPPHVRYPEELHVGDGVLGEATAGGGVVEKPLEQLHLAVQRAWGRGPATPGGLGLPLGPVLLDVANGDRFTVAAVTQDTITLHDGKREVVLPADRPLHVDHAYATTVHSSQGTTAERVLIDAATKSRTTAKDVCYVAISRARQEARIYTNDRARLPLATAREHRKHAAMELER
jgi:hypothetical protein